MFSIADDLDIFGSGNNAVEADEDHDKKKSNALLSRHREGGIKRNKEKVKYSRPKQPLGMFKEALNPSIRKSPHPEVNPDAPPRVPPSRGVSTGMKPKLEDELKRLTDLRLIALVD